MFNWLRGVFKKKEVVVTGESYPESTLLEDHVVAYFRTGYTDLARLAEAMGYKTQKELHDNINDYRVKVMMFEKGDNIDSSLKPLRDMHLIQTLRDNHRAEKVTK